MVPICKKTLLKENGNIYVPGVFECWLERSALKQQNGEQGGKLFVLPLETHLTGFPQL